MAITGYRILRKICQGGMSTVYLAIQKSVDREVALKVMSPTLVSDPSFGSRFYREAKIVGQLSHPNIVSIHDVGSCKQYNYIAMDFLPGAPLQVRLQGGLSLQQMLKVTTEIASALNYAHERGYIHRDVKPDNILFRADGSAVLSDFGIAKSVKGKANMTHVGDVLGTPHYMSPEQAQGKEIDGRSDLYSLGAVLFRMLTDNVPYPGNDPISVAVKHVSAPIPKLPPQLRKLQPIINRLLAKKPSARFQTGSELIEAIEQLQSGLDKCTTSNLSTTSFTGVQVFTLMRALATTLVTRLSLSVRRFLMGKKAFSNNLEPLTQYQLLQLDQFVMAQTPAESNTQQPEQPQSLNTTPPTPSASPKRWIYWSTSAAALLITGAVYLKVYHPQSLSKTTQAIFHRGAEISSHVPSPATTDVVTTAMVAPDPLPSTDHTKMVNTGHALTVNTTPKYARVRILNVKPVYHPGIELKPGSYHIEVSANGYESQRFWINMTNKSSTRSVALNPSRRTLPAGSIVTDKFANGSESVKMVVIASKNTATATTKIAISQFEITFQQYDQFAKNTQRVMPRDFQWGRDQRPVVGITYRDAQAYAAWVSKQTGKRYRLPTKQEWSNAAQAKDTSKYWWGKHALAKRANCRRGCSSQWSKWFSSSTAPVGSFPANDHNVYDTVGNAAEWLNDCVAWKDENKTQCTKALIAGGSHQDSVSKIRKNQFSTAFTDESSNTIGLRLVVEL